MLKKMLEPETLWENSIEKRNALVRIAMFTFMIGILVYIQMIVIWLTNPDGVWQGIVYKVGYGWEDSLGRVGLGMFNKLKGYFLYPSLQTIFCLFLISLITVLLYEMFQFRQRLYGGILGIIMVCSPFMCNLLTYYYTADAYLVAYFFSVLFVFILVKKANIRSVLIAAVLLACSLSLYQAFVGTSITLCLLYLLYKLIKDGEWKKVLHQGGYFLAAGCLGTILYLLIYKFYSNWKGILPTADRGFASMGRIPFQKLWPLTKQAYIYFADYYFTDNLINNS